MLALPRAAICRLESQRRKKLLISAISNAWKIYNAILVCNLKSSLKNKIVVTLVTLIWLFSSVVLLCYLKALKWAHASPQIVHMNLFYDSSTCPKKWRHLYTSNPFEIFSESSSFVVTLVAFSKKTFLAALAALYPPLWLIHGLEFSFRISTKPY